MYEQPACKFSSRTQKQSKSTAILSDLSLAFWFPWRDSITPIESQKMSGKDKNIQQAGFPDGHPL